MLYLEHCPSRCTAGTVAGFSESQFNDYYRQYLTAARSACPTTNILATIDYANSFPTQENVHLETLRRCTAQWRTPTIWTSGATWGQQV